MEQTDQTQTDQPLQINLGKNTHFTGDSMGDLGALAAKLSTVRSEVEYIEKTGENDYHGYSYVTERDLTEKIRKPLNEEGVMLFTSVEEKGSKGDMTKVVTEHAFVDGETGATLTVKSRGHGYDEQDKGVYKAVTGAVKYLLYKNFLIPAGDDPEKPPMVGPEKGDQIVEGAKKFGIEQEKFSKMLNHYFGISEAAKIHPGDVGQVKKMIRKKGSSPSQNQESGGQKETTPDEENPQPSQNGTAE